MSTNYSELLPSFAESPSEPPTPKTRRVYSEQQIAKALAIVDACGGNLTEAQRLSGVPDSTLSQWVNGHRRNMGAIPQLRNEIGLELIGSFQQIASEACRVGLARLQNPRKANKIPFAQLMTGAGIAVDKSQLLRGEPTSITASAATDDARKSKVREMLARIEARAIDVQVTEGNGSNSVEHISEGIPTSVGT